MSNVLPTSAPLGAPALREAFGAFPTGVVAVAAEVDGILVGLAASSFTSVSLASALAAFAIAKASTTWPLLRRARHIGVTVLGEKHGGLCRQLSGPAHGRFADVDVDFTDDGAATLADRGRLLVFHRSRFGSLAP